MKITFLFIHGSFESPEDAWFPWLKKQLELLGHTVIAPRFPVDSWQKVSTHPSTDYVPKQQLAAWFNVFESLRNKNNFDNNLCVVGHSLGPVFALLVAQKYSLPIFQAYFVAPFFEVYGKSEYIEKANDSFYHQKFDYPLLQSLVSNSTVIYSDNDPYVDEEKSLEFAEKIHSKKIKLHGLGHMDKESNLKEFPDLLDLIKLDFK